MLVHHTNVLFTEEQMNTLLALKQTQKTSVGGLIRQAVDTVYMQKSQKRPSNAFLDMRKRAKKHTQIPITHLDIQTWIHEGHTY